MKQLRRIKKIKTLYGRDLLERLEELRDEHETLKQDLEDAEEEDRQDAEEKLKEWEAENEDELKELESIEDDISNDSMLIPEYDFTEYCKELLQDCGDLPKELPWYIESNIDWEGVADDLKADYIEVEYQGKTYFVRD